MCGSMMGAAGMSGPMMVLPWLLFVTLFAVMALAVGVVAAKLLWRPAATSAASGESRALAEARERYARGEIDHAEFTQILDTLLGPSRLRGRDGS